MCRRPIRLHVGIPLGSGVEHCLSVIILPCLPLVLIADEADASTPNVSSICFTSSEASKSVIPFNCSTISSVAVERHTNVFLLTHGLTLTLAARKGTALVWMAP